MRLVVLTGSVSRVAGGLFHSTRRLSQAVEDTGWKVTVMSLADGHTTDDLGAWGQSDVVVMPEYGPPGFGYNPGWNRGLRTLQPEVVHSHGLWMYSSVVAQRWRGPRVVSPRGMLAATALKISGWKKQLAARMYENRNLRGAACLHALNENELAAIRAYGLRNPVAVIPNGVDLPRDVAPISGEKTCLYLGRFHPIKGLPGLLTAWNRLRPSNWRLVMAGWDQDGHEAELRRMGVPGVEFVGPKFGEEKAALLRSASAFVLPSLSEGLPMAVLEAWAYGLPVAMTEACSLPEGFAAGAAVRITNDGKGLEELLSMDHQGLQEMGRRGRRLVEERYTWPTVAAEMTRVYEWILDRAPQPESVRTV